MADITKPLVRISSSQSSLRVPRKQIQRLVEFVARAEGAKIAEVDLAVVTSQEIAGLNRRWLSHGGATDVISFDLSDSSRCGVVAQIIVCGDVAVREAPLHQATPRRELLLYVTHGLLHVLGYDDTSIRAAVRMHARQDQLLAEFLAEDARRQGNAE